MYIVMSKWEGIPGKENQWHEKSAEAKRTLMQIPGVEFMNRFQNDQGQIVVMMGYRDEDTYNKLVHDPTGAVAKFMAESGIEDVAQWVSSERGASID